MILRRVVESVKRHDWFAALVEFVLVIVGIVVGLQVSLWVEARQDRATERQYLERLLTDSDANIRILEDAITVHERRAAIFASLAASLESGGPTPTPAQLSDAMCRWFVQPPVSLQRGTYAELVSSGRLELLRDEDLRERIALEQAAHEDSDRTDRLAEAVFEVAAPIADYRQWRMDPSRPRGVTCLFDVAGMRADPRIRSAVPQLYRDQTVQIAFREPELAAVRATRERLSRLLN